MTPVRFALPILALVAAVLTAPAPAPAALPACERATAPFEVGTTTLTAPSRGEDLEVTVAYPAVSAGEGATPVCRKSPLVVAGHGSQGDGAAAARLHGYLVERGYVVAAPTLASSTFDIDGFAEDVSSTITAVVADSRAPGGELSGLVRRKQIGYIGTSMGAIIGLTLADRAHRDPRIDAVVAKAGRAFGSLAGAGAPPVLMINGDADTTIRYEDAKTAYAELGKPKGLIRLFGVGHDLNTRGDRILTTSSSLFLDHYLRGRKQALTKIEKAAESSGIASLRKRW